MLTKTDLLQIRKIIREEIEAESKPLQEDLRGEIKLSRIEIQKDIRGLKSKIKDLEISNNKIRKDIKKIVGFFDEEYLQVRKRVERLENHLNLPLGFLVASPLILL